MSSQQRDQVKNRDFVVFTLVSNEEQENKIVQTKKRLQDVKPPMRNIETNPFITKFTKYVCLGYIIFNLIINVETFKLWASFNWYVVTLSLLQISISVYGYFVSTLELSSTILTYMIEQWDKIEKMIYLTFALTTPIAILGMSGWRMADDVGIFNISQWVVWWSFVEVMPVIVISPAIAGTVFERQAEQNGLGHISNVALDTLYRQDQSYSTDSESLITNS